MKRARRIVYVAIGSLLLLFVINLAILDWNLGVADVDTRAELHARAPFQFYPSTVAGLASEPSGWLLNTYTGELWYVGAFKQYPMKEMGWEEE